MSQALLDLWSFDDNIRKFNFSANMESLWKEHFLSDVTVCCGDMTFSGHKVMLAASSTYFKKLFEKETGNEFTIVPENEKCSPKAVMFLLNFIYSKNIDIEVEDKAEMLAAASLLEMDHLIQIVLNLILNKFCSSSFLNDWDLIDLYGDDDCKTQFTKHVAQNFGTVIQHDEFLNLSRDRIVSILECTRGVCFWRMIPTEQLMKGILKWVRFTNTRAPFLPELISLININKLPLAWLVNLAEEEPSLSSIVIKPLCKKFWKREEVFVFFYTPLGDVLKTKNNITSLPLRLLNPITNLWLTVLRQLPVMLREGSICNWQQHIYSITETSITIYNIETETVLEIECKLSCFDPNGKSVATEETLYFILKNRLEKFDLKSKEQSWITLPAPLNDIVTPNIFCAQGHLCVIPNNLLIQRFKFATNEWDLMENLVLEDENTTDSNVVIYLNEEKGRLYVYRSKEPDVLQILGLQSIMTSERNLSKRTLGSKCPLVNVTLMRVEEISFPVAFKLLMVDSKGEQWTYCEDGFNDSLLKPSPKTIAKFNFASPIAMNRFGSEKGSPRVSLAPNLDNCKIENKKRDDVYKNISTNIIRGFTQADTSELGRRIFTNMAASNAFTVYTEKRKDQPNLPIEKADLQTYRPDFFLAKAFIGRINFDNMKWE